MCGRYITKRPGVLRRLDETFAITVDTVVLILAIPGTIAMLLFSFTFFILRS